MISTLPRLQYQRKRDMDPPHLLLLLVCTDHITPISIHYRLEKQRQQHH